MAQPGGNIHKMLMVKSIRLTENMVTFIKKRISLCGTATKYEVAGRRTFSAADVLDDRDPMGVPMQVVQRDIGGSSPNTGCKVLPLPSVNGLSVDVVNLTANGAGALVGKVDRGKIVDEMYPIEGIQLDPVHQVHGCRGARERWSTSHKAALQPMLYLSIIVVTARSIRGSDWCVIDIVSPIPRSEWARCRRSWSSEAMASSVCSQSLCGSEFSQQVP